MKNFLFPHLVFLVLIFICSSPEPLLALGGDDSDPSNQIGATTQDCQSDLLTATRTYIDARVSAIAACVNAFLNCESSSTTPQAQACRAALLEEDVGACAQGVLDSGIETMANTAAVLGSGSNAALEQALENFILDIQSNCYTMSAVLGVGGNGLGFIDGTSSSDALTDVLSKIPGGMGCQANAAVRTATPLIDAIADHLKTFDNTCIAVSDGVPLYQSCSVHGECGATSGKCGKLAYAFKNGELPGFPTCIESCNAGSFLSTDGLTCTPCDLGTYSSALNSSNCLPCSAGSYTALSGSRECTQCPRGYVQPNSQQTLCIPCNPGEAQSLSGRATCDLCSAGTYSSAAAVTCIDCPKGTYSDAGSEACTPCDPGSYASNAASNSCTLCVEGTFAEIPGSFICAACPAGSFAGSRGSTICTPCVAGTFAPDSQNFRCTDCAPGTYSDSGATACTECPAGTYATEPASSSCSPCPAGTFSDGGDANCTPCPVGSFSPNQGTSSCSPAPAGSQVSLPGQAAVTACAAGTFSSSSGAPTCTTCSPGTYSPTRGAIACVRCPRGTIAARNGAKTCKSCARGKTNSARTKCRK